MRAILFFCEVVRLTEGDRDVQKNKPHELRQFVSAELERAQVYVRKSGAGDGLGLTARNIKGLESLPGLIAANAVEYIPNASLRAAIGTLERAPASHLVCFDLSRYIYIYSEGSGPVIFDWKYEERPRMPTRFPKGTHSREREWNRPKSARRTPRGRREDRKVIR